MAAEGSSHGLASVGKKEFKQRFIDQFNIWKDGKGSEEGPKKEDDRVKTKSTLPPDQKIIGFKNEIKSMKNFLLDKKVYKNFKSLVIVGEYGVGKSALCQKIFNDEDVKSVYVPRIWVSMHHEEDTNEGEKKTISVLKRILKDLGVENKVFESIHEEAICEFMFNREIGEADGETETEKEISALLYALHLNLRWKKYLIVFDDVREEDNWNQKICEKLEKDAKWGKHLSDGFPKGSGGRVIYTTREVTLAKKLVAEEHEIHRLWPLSDHKYVWEIYEAAIKKKENVPRNDKKCIDELMNKSRGLPLAARRIAELPPVFLDDETETVDGGPTNKPADRANNQPAASPIPAN